MKALLKVMAGPDHLDLIEVPPEHAAAGEVRVRVGAAALCGTDVLIAQGLRDVKVPVILGHEFAGTVDEVGPDVTGIQVGQRVTTETDAFVCGRCRFCRTGDVHLCEQRRAIGQTVNGGFAEFAVVPAGGVHVLPPQVDLSAGALTEPLAVAVHAVMERALVQPDERVAVIGPGTIGLLAAQVAESMGARVWLCGLSRHATRFRLAHDLGIGSSVRLDNREDVAALGDATRQEGSTGVDVVIECSGAADGLSSGLGLVRKGGRVVLVGFYGAPIKVEADRVINSEVSLVASRGKRPSSFQRALELLRDGQVTTSGLVTHTFSLDAWRTAFAAAQRPGTKVEFQLDELQGPARPPNSDSPGAPVKGRDA